MTLEYAIELVRNKLENEPDVVPLITYTTTEDAAELTQQGCLVTVTWKLDDRIVDILLFEVLDESRVFQVLAA